jgi:hypothetical protein
VCMYVCCVCVYVEVMCVYVCMLLTKPKINSLGIQAEQGSGFRV